MVPTLPPGFLAKAQRGALGLVGLTVALMVVGAVSHSQEALKGGLGSLPWGAVGLLVLAAVGGNLLRFWRYHSTAKALHLNVPFFSMLFIHAVGYGLLPTPGKVGTAIRLWLLKQRHGLPYARTAPVFVMDLITDAIAIFALCAVSLVLLPGLPKLNLAGALLGVGLLVGVGGLVLAPHALGQGVKVLYWLAGKRKKRLFGKLLRLIQTTRTVLGPRLLALTVAQSLAGWGLIAWATAHLLTALGAPLSLAQGAAAVTLSVTGGFISLMPAGVGGAELSMAGTLALFQVPMGTALLATALWRLIVTWGSVVVGLALLPVALRQKTASRPAGQA